MRKKVAGKRHVSSSTSPGSSPVKNAPNKGNPISTEVRDQCASSRSARDPHTDVHNSAHDSKSKTLSVNTVVNETPDDSWKNRNIEGMTGDAREAGKVADRQAEDDKGFDNIENRFSKLLGSSWRTEKIQLCNDTVDSANNDSFGNNKPLEEDSHFRDLTGSEQKGGSLKSPDTGLQLDGVSQFESTAVDNENDKSASVKVFEGKRYQVRDPTGSTIVDNEHDKGAHLKVFEGMKYHVINVSPDLKMDKTSLLLAGKTKKSMADGMNNFKDIPEHFTVTNPGTKNTISDFLRKKQFCGTSLPMQADSNEGHEKVVSGNTNVMTKEKSVLPFSQSRSSNNYEINEMSAARKLKECAGPTSGSNTFIIDKNNVMTESGCCELNNLPEKDMKNVLSNHSGKMTYKSNVNTDLVKDIPDFKAKNVVETVPSPDSTVTSYEGCNVEETTETETNSFKMQSDNNNGKKVNHGIEVENLEIPNSLIGESTSTEMVKDITDGHTGVLTSDNKKSVNNQSKHHEKKSDGLRLAEKAAEQDKPVKEPEKEMNGEPSVKIKFRTIQQGVGQDSERTTNAENTNSDSEGALNAVNEETLEPFRVEAVHFGSQLPCSPGPDNLLLQNLVSPSKGSFLTQDKTPRTYHVTSPSVNIVTSSHFTPDLCTPTPKKFTATSNMVTPTQNMLTPTSNTVTSCMLTPDQTLVSTSVTQSASIDSSSGNNIKTPAGRKEPIFNLAQSLKQSSAGNVTNSDGTNILSVTGTLNLGHKNVDSVNACNSSHSKDLNTSLDMGIVNFSDSANSISLRHRTMSNLLTTRHPSHMVHTVPPAGLVNDSPKGVSSNYDMPSQDRIFYSSTHEFENQKVIAERIPDITYVIDTSNLLINHDSPMKKITRNSGSYSQGHTTDWQRSQEQAKSVFVNTADVRNMSQPSSILNGSQYSSDRNVLLDLGKNSKILPVSTHYQTIASRGTNSLGTAAAPNTVKCSVPYLQGQSYNQGQVLVNSIGQGPALSNGQEQALSSQPVQSGEGFKKPQRSVNHPVSPTKYKAKHLKGSKPQACNGGKKQISLVKDNDGESVSDLDDSFLAMAGNLIESESDAEFLTANMPDDSEFEMELSQEDDSDNGDTQQLGKQKENKRIRKKGKRGRKKKDKPLKDKYYVCCQSVNKEAEKAAEDNTKKTLQDFLKKGGTASRKTEVPPNRKYNFKEEKVVIEKPKYIDDNQMFVFTSKSDIQLMLDNKDLLPTMLSERRDGTMKLVNKVLKNKSTDTNVKDNRYCGCPPDMLGEEIPVEQVFLCNGQLFRLPDANVIRVGRLEFYSFFREDKFHVPVDNLFKKVGSKVGELFRQAMKNWKSLVLHSLTTDEIQLLEQKIEFDVNNAYTDLISLKDVQEIGMHLLNIEPDDLTLKMLAFSIPCKRILGSQVRCANCGMIRKTEGLEKASYFPIVLNGDAVKLDQGEKQSLIEASIGTAQIGEDNFTAFEIEKNIYMSVKQIVKHGLLSLTQVQTNLAKLNYKPTPPPKEIEDHIRCNLCFIEKTLWIDFVTLRCIVCMEKMKNVTASNIAKGQCTYAPEYCLMCKENWKDESLFEIDSRALTIKYDGSTVKMKNHEMPFIISVGRKKPQNYLDYEVDSTTDWKEGSNPADAENFKESEIVIQVEEVGSNVVITCKTDDSSGQRNKHIQASSTTIDAINEECKRALRPRKKKTSYVETFEKAAESDSENEVDLDSDKNYKPNINRQRKSKGTKKDENIVLGSDDDHFVTNLEKFYKKLDEGSIQTPLGTTVELQTEDEKAAYALQYLNDTEDKNNKMNDFGFSLDGNSLLRQAIQISGISSSLSEVASQSNIDGGNTKHVNVEVSNKNANEPDKEQQCEVYLQSVICTARKMGSSPIKEERQVTGSERTEQLENSGEKSTSGYGKPVKKNCRSKDEESANIIQQEKKSLGGNTENKTHAVPGINEKRNDSKLLCQTSEIISPQAKVDKTSCTHIQTNAEEVLLAVADTAALSKADCVAYSNEHVVTIVPDEVNNHPGFATIDLNESLHLLAAVATDSGITENKILSGRSILIQSPHSLSINEHKSEIAKTFEKSEEKKSQSESSLINTTNAVGFEKENERKLRNRDNKKNNKTNTAMHRQEKSTETLGTGSTAQADNSVIFVSSNEIEDLQQNQKVKDIQIPPENNNIQTNSKKKVKGKIKRASKNKPFETAKEKEEINKCFTLRPVKGKHKECEKEIENHREGEIELTNKDIEVKYSEMMNTDNESDNSKLNSDTTAVSIKHKSETHVNTESISSRSEPRNSDTEIANEVKVEQNEKVGYSKVLAHDNTPTSSESKPHTRDMTEDEQRKEMDAKIRKYIVFAYNKGGSQPGFVVKRFREGAEKAFPALFLPHPDHPETQNRQKEFMKAAGAYMNKLYIERKQQLLNKRSQKRAVHGNGDTKKDKDQITAEKVCGEGDACSTKCPDKPSQTRTEKCSHHVDYAVNPNDKSLHGKVRDKTDAINKHSKHVLDRNGNLKAAECTFTEKPVGDNLTVKPVLEKSISTDKRNTNLCDSDETEKHTDSVRSDEYESIVTDRSKDNVISKPALKNGQTCKELSEVLKENSRVDEPLYSENRQTVKGTDPVLKRNNTEKFNSEVENSNETIKKGNLQENKKMKRNLEEMDSQQGSKRRKLRSASRVKDNESVGELTNTEDIDDSLKPNDSLDSDSNATCFKPTKKTSKRGKDSSLEKVKQFDASDIVQTSPTENGSPNLITKIILRPKPVFESKIVQDSMNKRKSGKEKFSNYKILTSILNSKLLLECNSSEESRKKIRFGMEKLNESQEGNIMAKTDNELKKDESADPELVAVYNICDQTEIVDDIIPKIKVVKQKSEMPLETNTENEISTIKLRSRHKSEGPQELNNCWQVITNSENESSTIKLRSRNETPTVKLRSRHKSEGHEQLNKTWQVETNSQNETPTVKLQSRHKSEGHEQLNKTWQVETNSQNETPTVKLRSRHKSEDCQQLGKSWQAELRYGMNDSPPKSGPTTEIACPQEFSLEIVKSESNESLRNGKRLVNNDVSVTSNKRGNARKTGENPAENVGRSLRGRSNVKNIVSSLNTCATNREGTKTKQEKTIPEQNDITAATDLKLVIDRKRDFDETTKSHQTLVKRLKRTDDDKWAIENAVSLPACFVVLKRLAVLEDAVSQK